MPTNYIKLVNPEPVSLTSTPTSNEINHNRLKIMEKYGISPMLRLLYYPKFNKTLKNILT